MLRQPERLAGVSAIREHIKAVNQMALLNCGGIDGETSMDMLGWGRPKGIVGTQWWHRGERQRLGLLGKLIEAVE